MLMPFEWVVGDSSKDHTVTALTSSTTCPATGRYTTMRDSTAYRADPDILNRALIWPTTLGDALNLLAGAALACQRRWDCPLPVWTLIGMFTRGQLLPLPPPLRT